MSGTYEDLIRPLGLVTLYAAYTEGELDELLDAAWQRTFDDKKRQWPVDRKLVTREDLSANSNPKVLRGLMALTEARELFEKRNALVRCSASAAQLKR